MNHQRRVQGHVIALRFNPVDFDDRQEQQAPWASCHPGQLCPSLAAAARPSAGQLFARNVILVSSGGRPSRSAKPGHRPVPLLT